MLYLIRPYGERLSVKVHELLVIEACEENPVSCAPFVLEMVSEFEESCSCLPHREYRNPFHSTIRQCQRVVIQDVPLSIS